MSNEINFKKVVRYVRFENNLCLNIRSFYLKNKQMTARDTHYEFKSAILAVQFHILNTYSKT